MYQFTQFSTISRCLRFWLIDRLTAQPYSRWRSRIVDRLIITIETGGGNRG